ncbi:hypothetical protein GGF31_007962 [Allomyces arbusculus]|nr:hypothetical protein GGF31_007962 [Allomyces arbusculus]
MMSDATTTNRARGYERHINAPTTAKSRHWDDDRDRDLNKHDHNTQRDYSDDEDEEGGRWSRNRTHHDDDDDSGEWRRDACFDDGDVYEDRSDRDDRADRADHNDHADHDGEWFKRGAGAHNNRGRDTDAHMHDAHHENGANGESSPHDDTMGVHELPEYNDANVSYSYTQLVQEHGPPTQQFVIPQGMSRCDPVANPNFMADVEFRWDVKIYADLVDNGYQISVWGEPAKCTQARASIVKVVLDNIMRTTLLVVKHDEFGNARLVPYPSGRAFAQGLFMPKNARPIVLRVDTPSSDPIKIESDILLGRRPPLVAQNNGRRGHHAAAPEPAGPVQELQRPAELVEMSHVTKTIKKQYLCLDDTNPNSSAVDRFMLDWCHVGAVQLGTVANEDLKVALKLTLGKQLYTVRQPPKNYTGGNTYPVRDLQEWVGGFADRMIRAHFSAGLPNLPSTQGAIDLDQVITHAIGATIQAFPGWSIREVPTRGTFEVDRVSLMFRQGNNQTELMTVSADVRRRDLTVAGGPAPDPPLSSGAVLYDLTPVRLRYWPTRHLSMTQLAMDPQKLDFRVKLTSKRAEHATLTTLDQIPFPVRKAIEEIKVVEAVHSSGELYLRKSDFSKIDRRDHQSLLYADLKRKQFFVINAHFADPNGGDPVPFTIRVTLSRNARTGDDAAEKVGVYELSANIELPRQLFVPPNDCAPATSDQVDTIESAPEGERQLELATKTMLLFANKLVDELKVHVPQPFPHRDIVDTPRGGFGMRGGRGGARGGMRGGRGGGRGGMRGGYNGGAGGDHRRERSPGHDQFGGNDQRHDRDLPSYTQDPDRRAMPPPSSLAPTRFRSASRAPSSRSSSVLRSCTTSAHAAPRDNDNHRVWSPPSRRRSPSPPPRSSRRGRDDYRSLSPTHSSRSGGGHRSSHARSPSPVGSSRDHHHTGDSSSSSSRDKSGSAQYELGSSSSGRHRREDEYAASSSSSRLSRDASPDSHRSRERDYDRDRSRSSRY